MTDKYRDLSIAVVGDFCLDRYLEIDPEKKETSIETGLPVYNVVNVRAQPGAAGTVLNNLVDLGVKKIFPVGFCGLDGEGYELQRALAAARTVDCRFFTQTNLRRTFTYCKPLVIANDKTPVELNRLDSKNWTPTPASLEHKLADAIVAVSGEVDAIVVLDQVDIPDTGVISPVVLGAIAVVARAQPSLPIVADSRRGLRDFPPVIFKMNRAELAALNSGTPFATVEEIREHASLLAQKNRRNAYITLAENGMVAASPDGKTIHRPAFPVRGPIDVVGAGDAVTANLAASLAAGATLEQSLELAGAGASIVLHQPGTTGTASVAQIKSLLFQDQPAS